MKKLEAIIRSSQFELVRDKLRDAGIYFFTFYEVKGYGHQDAKNISYRGAVYDMGYIGRIKLEILVSEEYLEVAHQAILNGAYTGEKGDGLIMISDILELTNIRTGLKNEESINK